jgi:hypothetical protein
MKWSASHATVAGVLVNTAREIWSRNLAPTLRCSDCGMRLPSASGIRKPPKADPAALLGHTKQLYDFDFLLGDGQMKLDDFIPYAPFVAVFGPIIGAIIGAVVTLLYVVKRRKVAFSISESEDVTLPLHREHRNIVFKIGDREMKNLNRASILVKNTGNTTISDFHFDVEIPGQRQNALADKLTENEKLHAAIDIGFDDPSPPTGPRFHIKMPFFNAKETFEIILFFDGSTTDCNVHCRMEDLKRKIKRKDFLSEITLEIGGTFFGAAMPKTTGILKTFMEVIEKVSRRFPPV